MMELKTLRDMIAAVYGGLYAEDCAMVDREWARMRGYILPTDGRSALMSVEKDDIIQIVPKHKWGGCLAVVDEPKSFGCLCHVKMPGKDGSISRAYIRIDTADYEEIGAKARPTPVQAGAMHPEQQRIAAELNARQAGADAAEFDIEQARRDLIKDQQDLIDTQQKRIKAIRDALERCTEELAESLKNEGRLASFKAAIEKGRAALSFPPLADHAEPSVDFMFQAAERANKRFGKLMPQQWLEIFIDEMVGRS